MFGQTISLKIAATMVAVLGLAGGLAGMVGATSSIDNTGPDSENHINNDSTKSWEAENNNDVDVSNSNSQTAYSGDAKVKHNTTGGDATSGDATNENSFEASLSVTNSSCGCGDEGSSDGIDWDASIDTTGPDSNNTINNTSTSTMSVQNNNSISVTNSNSQSATSGDARVSGNTTGGNATSGSASNSNSSSVTLTISN